MSQIICSSLLGTGDARPERPCLIRTRTAYGDLVGWLKQKRNKTIMSGRGVGCARCVSYITMHFVTKVETKGTVTLICDIGVTYRYGCRIQDDLWIENKYIGYNAHDCTPILGFYEPTKGQRCQHYSHFTRKFLRKSMTQLHTVGGIATVEFQFLKSKYLGPCSYQE